MTTWGWVVLCWMMLCCYRAYDEYRWLGADRFGAFVLAFGAPALIPYYYGGWLIESRRKKE